MNAVVELKQTGIVPNAGRLSVAEVTQHAIAVQEIMKGLMKANVHYGVIPGTKQPTLYKAGAELLCMTFRIADEYRIEQSNENGAIRYRVTCVGRHQVSGLELGSGLGECSTGEEKYRWRKAVCKEEFEATPADLRRIKYSKGRDGHYTIEQVRTESADLANTVLKMACKRAKMAMVLNVTAASDCFSQDLEDLDEVLREHLTEEPVSDPALAAKWVTLAETAADKAALQATWKEGVAAIKAAKDMTAYNAFKDAVEKRKAALTQPVEQSTDEFVKGME